jgi:hypothetical protein
VLAWLIAGVLISIFVIALFFFWWHWASWHRVATARELEEVEAAWRSREVELHVELGDRSVAMVFKVMEASSRAAAM